MSLDGLSREAAVFSLEIVRTAGLVSATPILFSSAPARVRGAVALLLALVSHAANGPSQGGTPSAAGGVAPPSIDSFEQVALSAPCELLIGVAMGMVMRFLLAIAEIMGDAISPVLGLNAVTLFDPQSQLHETPVTRILRMLMLLLALLMGIHRVLLSALIQSFRVIPVGVLVDPSLATPELIRLSGVAIAAGVRLAIPVLAVLMIIQIGLAFVSRAAPSLQLFSIGFGITIFAGGAIIFSSLHDFAREFERELSQMGVGIEAVLSTMLKN